MRGVGAAGGYLGLIPRDDGPWVAVQVFESESLAGAWQELDEFEGSEYQRVLIPVSRMRMRVALLGERLRPRPLKASAYGTSNSFPAVCLDSSAECALPASPNGSSAVDVHLQPAIRDPAQQLRRAGRKPSCVAT
jgi:hypothetical protein